jgi:hypothetical protein
MTDEKRPLKVFLCHARNDKAQARELFRYLKRRKVDAWLDETNLLPGQDWDLEIYKATRDADVIIICISKESIAKEGYVQKEIRRALDISEEKPDGTIFVIPLRLEECEVPIRLKKYQWVDLFDEGGYEKLMKSLKLRAVQLQRNIVQTPKTNETQLEVHPKPESGQLKNTPIQGKKVQPPAGLYSSSDSNGFEPSNINSNGVMKISEVGKEETDYSQPIAKPKPNKATDQLVTLESKSVSPEFTSQKPSRKLKPNILLPSSAQPRPSLL